MPRRTSKNAPVDSGDYKKVERGEIQKWNKGTEVEGVYEGMREGSGKFKRPDGTANPIVDIRREDSTLLTFGCPRGLELILSKVKKGMMVKIVCVGKKKLPNRPQPMWDFVVYQKKA